MLALFSIGLTVVGVATMVFGVAMFFCQTDAKLTKLERAVAEMKRALEEHEEAVVDVAASSYRAGKEDTVRELRGNR